MRFVTQPPAASPDLLHRRDKKFCTAVRLTSAIGCVKTIPLPVHRPRREAAPATPPFSAVVLLEATKLPSGPTIHAMTAWCKRDEIGHGD